MTVTQSTGTQSTVASLTYEVRHNATVYDSAYVIDDGHDHIMIGFERGDPNDGFIVNCTRRALEEIRAAPLVTDK